MSRPEALAIEPLLPISAEPQDAYTLPSELYTDESVFGRGKRGDSLPALALRRPRINGRKCRRLPDGTDRG